MRHFILIIFIIGSSIGLPVLAEDKPIIGVIDWRGAIFSTKEAERENAKIKREFKKDTQKLKSLEKKITTARKKLQNSNDLLKEEQKEKLLVDLQNDVLAYESLRQEVETKVQERENKFIEKQNKRMKKIVEEIAEEKDLHAIMRIDTVIYGRLTLDITDDVVKILNAKQ